MRKKKIRKYDSIFLLCHKYKNQLTNSIPRKITKIKIQKHMKHLASFVGYERHLFC